MKNIFMMILLILKKKLFKLVFIVGKINRWEPLLCCSLFLKLVAYFFQVEKTIILTKILWDFFLSVGYPISLFDILVTLKMLFIFAKNFQVSKHFLLKTLSILTNRYMLCTVNYEKPIKYYDKIKQVYKLRYIELLTLGFGRLSFSSFFFRFFLSIS